MNTHAVNAQPFLQKDKPGKIRNFVPTGKEIYEIRRFTAVKVLDCGLVG